MLSERAKRAMVERFKRAPFADKVTPEMLATVAVEQGTPWHEAFVAACRALPFMVDCRRAHAIHPDDRPRLRWNHVAGAWRLR